MTDTTRSLFQWQEAPRKPLVLVEHVRPYIDADGTPSQLYAHFRQAQFGATTQVIAWADVTPAPPVTLDTRDVALLRVLGLRAGDATWTRRHKGTRTWACIEASAELRLVDEVIRRLFGWQSEDPAAWGYFRAVTYHRADALDWAYPNGPF